jgi:hypothetical protein
MRPAPGRANHGRRTDDRRQQPSASSCRPICHGMGSSASSLRALWRVRYCVIEASATHGLLWYAAPCFSTRPLESFSIDLWRVCHHL